jgi:hypothetical protein
VERNLTVLDEKEKKLDEIYEKFEDLETQFEQFITSENATNLEAKTKEFEEQFWRIKNTINNCRDTIKKDKKENEDDDEKSDEEDTEEQSIPVNPNQDGLAALLEVLKGFQVNQKIGIRIPELTLPKFSGGFDNWIGFWQLYEEAIHKEKKYAKIEKFSYLLSCLSSEIRKDLEAKFPLSTENYELAIAYLKKQHGNKRLIITKHFSELFKIEPIEKENLDELQTLVNCYSTNIEQAKRMSSENNLFDQLIIFMVSSKLDESTRKSWENHIKNEKLPNWDNMRKFLEDRVAMLVSMRFERQCVMLD